MRVTCNSFIDQCTRIAICARVTKSDRARRILNEFIHGASTKASSWSLRGRRRAAKMSPVELAGLVAKKQKFTYTSVKKGQNVTSSRAPKLASLRDFGENRLPAMVENATETASAGVVSKFY
jgi:hypothetical protein